MMVSEAQRAVQQDPSNGAALGILAGGYALLGEKEKTREWIDRALLIDPDNLNMRYNFACVLAGHLGDKEGAIKMLQSTLALVGRIPGPDRGNRYGLRQHSRRPRIPEDYSTTAKKRLGLISPAADFSRAALMILTWRLEHLTLHRALALGGETGASKIFFTTSMPSVTWPKAAKPLASPPGPPASKPACRRAG